MPSPDLDPAIAALLNGDLVDALRQQGRGDIPLLPASNEGLEAEFFGRVYQYLRCWLMERSGPTPDVRPSAIVLSRAIHQDIGALGAEIVPYFEACPDLDIGGKLYVANDDLTIVAEVPATAGGTVTSVAMALKSLRLDQSPHIVFRPDRGEVILSREGVLGPNSCVGIDLGALKRLSQLDLEREMWRFHKLFTQTPSGHLFCWKGSPAERVTVEQLERQISGLLAYHLSTIIGLDHVTMEHYTPHGRLDVKVSGSAMLPGIGPCALELKVLRSRMASGKKKYTSVSVAEMVKHASDGVQQAVEYRDMIEGNLAYLCCFDARFADEDQPEIEQLAKDNDVILRRYFMYESPKAHRTAAAAAKKAGKLLSGEVQ